MVLKIGSTPVQTAWGATRTNGGYFKDKFVRLSMHKSQKKALIAIARKIGVIVYCVLKQKKPFNPAMLVVHDPLRIRKKMEYHQREWERLSKLA